MRGLSLQTMVCCSRPCHVMRGRFTTFCLYRKMQRGTSGMVARYGAHDGLWCRLQASGDGKLSLDQVRGLCGIYPPVTVDFPVYFGLAGKVRDILKSQINLSWPSAWWNMPETALFGLRCLHGRRAGAQPTSSF